MCCEIFNGIYRRICRTKSFFLNPEIFTKLATKLKGVSFCGTRSMSTIIKNNKLHTREFLNGEEAPRGFSTTAELFLFRK